MNTFSLKEEVGILKRSDFDALDRFIITFRVFKKLQNIQDILLDDLIKLRKSVISLYFLHLGSCGVSVIVNNLNVALIVWAETLDVLSLYVCVCVCDGSDRV